jgi:hypothetical protein
VSIELKMMSFLPFWFLSTGLLMALSFSNGLSWTLMLKLGDFFAYLGVLPSLFCTL